MGRKKVKTFCLLLSLVLILLIFSLAEGGNEWYTDASSETFSKALEANLEIATYVYISRNGDGGYIFYKFSSALEETKYKFFEPEDSLEVIEYYLDKFGYAIVKKVTIRETILYCIYPYIAFPPDGMFTKLLLEVINPRQEETFGFRSPIIVTCEDQELTGYRLILPDSFWYELSFQISPYSNVNNIEPHKTVTIKVYQGSVAQGKPVYEIQKTLMPKSDNYTRINLTGLIDPTKIDISSFFPSSTDVQAQINTIVWRIGKHDVEDFVPQQEKVIDYQVPVNWRELLAHEDPNWGAFPLELYSEAAGKEKTQEIRINFDYPEDYSNPILYIKYERGYVSDVSAYHHLVISKGNNPGIGSCGIEPSSICMFSLGYIKKGLHDQNRIIIKVESPSDVPLDFYSLWVSLNETDKDGDGVSDDDEGDVVFSEDKTTACIPIRSYDPKDIERITLHIEGLEGLSSGFSDLQFLDPNALNLPENILSTHYFPYGFLGFRIVEINPDIEQGQVILQIRYPDELYPSVCFYTFQNNVEWQEINFEIIDTDSVNIPLKDGGTGDFDGRKDGTINTKLILAYPRGLGTQIEKSGCFIEEISREKNK